MRKTQRLFLFVAASCDLVLFQSSSQDRSQPDPDWWSPRIHPRGEFTCKAVSSLIASSANTLIGMCPRALPPLTSKLLKDLELSMFCFIHLAFFNHHIFIFVHFVFTCSNIHDESTRTFITDQNKTSFPRYTTRGRRTPNYVLARFDTFIHKMSPF